MTSIFTKLCAAAAMAVAFTALPAQAAGPVYYGGAEVQNAQFSFGFSTGNDDRRHRDRFERRGGYYYYNGHRGYRDRHPGFRFYNGYWFPQSAFRFGITIDGRDRDRYDRGGRSSLSQRHIEWCENRYRSYRASDNSFQPYNGGRQECVSPYSR